MDWQFYTYCQNVSMYKTRLLSWIDSSTCIVGMFLCIKLKVPVMNWQFYMYYRNVSMYKTRFLS